MLIFIEQEHNGEHASKLNCNSLSLLLCSCCLWLHHSRVFDSDLTRTDVLFFVALNKTMPKTRAGASKEEKVKVPASLNGADWRYSDAKKKVAQDIIDGHIPSTGKFDVEQLFQNRYAKNPLFANFPFRQDLYTNRIEGLRRGILKMKRWADFDDKAVKNDRLIHPRKEKNVRGQHRWDGSDAQELLKIDIAAGKHKDMDPEDLWKERAAYLRFDLHVFRKHIDQEIQSSKPHKSERRRKKGHYGDNSFSDKKEDSSTTKK